MSKDLFHHTYRDNKAPKTLVTLHGTGGDEHDFLFLDELLDKKYNILGLRGNVDEQGLNRFFKRLEFGVFDQENIKDEVEKLTTFIKIWDQHELTFLGYSNGANMILATLFYHPEIIKNSLLLHPMIPFTPMKQLNLSMHKIMLTYGTQDEMVSVEESQELITLLKSFNADVTVKQYASGHQLTHTEIRDVSHYLKL